MLYYLGVMQWVIGKLSVSSTVFYGACLTTIEALGSSSRSWAYLARKPSWLLLRPGLARVSPLVWFGHMSTVCTTIGWSYFFADRHHSNDGF